MDNRYTKKDFFSKKSVAQLKKEKLVKVESLDDLVEVAENSNGLLISQGVINLGYWGENLSIQANKFMRHASLVYLGYAGATQRELKEEKVTPEKERSLTFNNIFSVFKRGYAITPAIRLDKRKRIIPLTECVEGLKLYTYSMWNGANVEPVPYSSCLPVGKKGGKFAVSVPSRTPKKRRYEFILHSVPLIDNDEAFVISRSLNTDHICKEGNYQGLKHAWHNSTEERFDAHEIAGYLNLIDFLNNKGLSSAKVAYRFNPFALPTQRLVNYHQTLENSLIEYETSEGKLNVKPLNRAEREICLWQAVKDLGYDETFKPNVVRDGLVKDYNWLS